MTLATLIIPLCMKGAIPPDRPETSRSTPTDAEKTAEDTVRVLLSDSGETLTLSLRDYVAGVTAAEMPVSFDREALCAQALAALSVQKIGTAPSMPSRDEIEAFLARR